VKKPRSADRFAAFLYIRVLADAAQTPDTVWHIKRGSAMQNTYDVSRRRMLELAALSGLAVTGALPRAHAQSAAKRIEKLAPELDAIISTSEPILELATGFGGGGNTEGPVWWKEGGFVLFSSIGENKVIKYTPGQGTSVYREKTNGANGHTRDMQGRLVACEGLARRVTREEKDGSFTVIANSYQGKRINKPNDVVVKSDGSIYFTDPAGGATGDPWEVTGPGVYRVSADALALVAVGDHRDAAVGIDAHDAPGIAFASEEAALGVASQAVGAFRALFEDRRALARRVFDAAIVADVAEEKIAAFLPPHRSLGRARVTAVAFGEHADGLGGSDDRVEPRIKTLDAFCLRRLRKRRCDAAVECDAADGGQLQHFPARDGMISLHDEFLPKSGAILTCFVAIFELRLGLRGIA